MLKKKFICIITAICMTFCFTACGKKEDSVDNTVPKQTTEIITESKDTGATDDTEDVPKENEEELSEEVSEENTEENTEETSETSDNDVENISEKSGKYVDFNEMCFYINDKKYVLGKTTLQEMIDDGVPFDENDLTNAGNNLNPDYKSQGFRIRLGEYYTAQVFAFNDTEENKPISECYINYVYLPVKEDEEPNILTFNFPTDMTMEELKENSGEPTNEKHTDFEDGRYVDQLEYENQSEIYIRACSYKFEFISGKLKYINIEYMP